MQKRLILRSDNLIALPLRLCYKTIRELHLSQSHPLDSELFELARSRFAADQRRDVCRRVVSDCLRCQEGSLPRRTSGPMRHLTVDQRKEIAAILGIQSFNPPELSDADDLDPTKFVPRIQNRMSIHYNCVCACISFLLTGRVAGGRRLQEIVIRERTGSNPHLYALPRGSKGWSRPEDIDFISTMDLRVLARFLKIHIYMW